ncbi:MAG: PAS domain-containing protein, partial [Chloroflexota bacterium]
MVRQEPHLGNRWLHITVDPVLGPQGEVVSLVHTVRDVSTEKRHQENLERLNRVSLSLSASLDLGEVVDTAVAAMAPASGTAAIALLDETESHLEVVAARGLHGEDVRGMRIALDQLPPEVVKQVRVGQQVLLLEDASQAPQVLRDLPHWHEYRTFVVFPLVVRGQAIGVLTISSTEAGPPSEENVGFLNSYAAAIALAVDNARLYRETDWELRRRVAQMEAIMASMGEGLVVADTQGVVLFCNRAAEALLGVERTQFLGQPTAVFNQLLSTRIVEPARWQRALAEGLERAKGEVGYRFPFTALLPERRELEATLFVVESGGRRLGTGAVLRDVTREREVDRMKSDFIAIASHELRTPMTVV